MHLCPIDTCKPETNWVLKIRRIKSQSQNSFFASRGLWQSWRRSAASQGATYSRGCSSSWKCCGNPALGSWPVLTSPSQHLGSISRFWWSCDNPLAALAGAFGAMQKPRATCPSHAWPLLLWILEPGFHAVPRVPLWEDKSVKPLLLLHPVQHQHFFLSSSITDKNTQLTACQSYWVMIPEIAPFPTLTGVCFFVSSNQGKG